MYYIVVLYTVIIGVIEYNMKIVKLCSFLLFVNTVSNFESNNKAIKKRNQNITVSKVNFIHGQKTGRK